MNEIAKTLFAQMKKNEEKKNKKIKTNITRRNITIKCAQRKQYLNAIGEQYSYILY